MKVCAAMFVMLCVLCACAAPNPVVEPQIQADFSPEGVAFVANAKGWSCINRKGEVLLAPYLFDNGPDGTSEGLFRFVEGKKVGFADASCRVSIPAAYDFAEPFQEGLAAVCNGCRTVPSGVEHTTVEGGLWGYIDKKGTVVIPLQFEAADSFEDGKAAVRRDRKPLVIDRAGTVLR